MMDMLSTGVATTLLVVALLAAALGFIAMRVLGAREVADDHPVRGSEATPLPSRVAPPHTGASSDEEDPS